MLIPGKLCGYLTGTEPSNPRVCRLFFSKEPGGKCFIPGQVLSSAVISYHCSVTKPCLTLCDPWTAARQASLSFTISQSLLKCMSIKSVIPPNHLILCRPLLLLPSIFPSIRVFSTELALRIRWPKYWSFSFSISPSNEYSG